MYYFKPPTFDYERIFNELMENNYFDYDKQDLNRWTDKFRELVEKRIEEYTAESDDCRKIGIVFTNNAQSEEMVIEEIACVSAAIMAFKGRVGDRNATLFQHVSQLNFLLTTVECNSNNEK